MIDNGNINTLEVAAVINQFLGLHICHRVDAHNYGAVNTLDVVFAINHVLGV
jgi:hypothetical protein